MQFANPIIPGFYPDPSICRVGEDYYLVTSSFEFFPGVPIFHSRDLVNWKQIGHCLTRKSQLDLDKAAVKGGIYAPTLRYHDGLFYMVTTNVSHGGNFYVTAKDPAGEWSDPIRVDLPLIDPTLFFDDDGKVYFTCVKFDGDKTYGAGLSQIDIVTGKLLTEHRMIWTGSGGSFPEAPHIYKLNGFYYLMLAEGGTHTGHMVTIARSKNIWGPYEGCPHNPILSHRNRTGMHPIQATGHGDIIEAHDGSWWMVFLGIRHGSAQPRFHNLGRETFLAPVAWDKAGWPVVNGGKVIELSMPAPNLKPYPFEAPPVRDDFSGQKLNFCWNFLRNPRQGSWSLQDRTGFLTLHGSELTLNDIDAPAFVGRRQQHTNCKASALLEFDPKTDGQEAGLAVFMNDRHHYEIAVTCENANRRIILRRRIGRLCAVEANEALPHGKVILEIQADKQNYYFRYGINGANGSPAMRELGCGETRYLSTEVAGGFTGVYFAMYSTGSGKPSSVAAAFDWFDYVPLPD